MGIVRAEVIQRMAGAIKAGVSASKFITKMREAGLSYRRTDMLADWRSVGEIKKKEGTLRYVRKDRYPTEKIIASVTWDMEKEFMYVVRVKTQISPDEPVLEHNINIQTDAPITPEMIIEEVIEKRSREEKYFGEIIVEVTPWTVVRKVSE